MGRRTHGERIVDALVEIGTVVSTAIGAATSVISRLRGDAPMDDESDNDPLETEEVGDVETWGEANLLSRPLDPTDDGACEALFVRRGDTREIVGMRDRRWQITLEQGEVVVRNIVADPSQRAKIHIKANGEVVIDSPKVYVGDAGAGHTIAWGDSIKGHLDDLKTWADAHTHGYLGDSAVPALTSPPTTTPAPPWTPLDPSPSVPSIESTHVVE